MTARPALRLVPSLDQVRGEINAGRLLWMKRERVFGISREALRKAVTHD